MHNMICDICEEEFEGTEMNEGQDLDGQFTCVCDDCDARDDVDAE